MPEEQGFPPPKRFKAGSPLVSIPSRQAMQPATPRKTVVPLDVQRRQLPIYQARPQLLGQLRGLETAVLIVRRDFSVLEDGALAHCLQEQESPQPELDAVRKTSFSYHQISSSGLDKVGQKTSASVEQHYASNVQKNKLVQKDIRIAKKLQGEEDERNRLRSLEKQRQIEERDSEYARVIQEELRRKAEECRQREEEDKEIAKRLQELEREEVRRWSEESPTRSEELERSGSRHRLQRHRSKQDDEYSIYQNPKDKSPITGDTSRSQWTPEPDRARHSSKECTSDLSLASDSTCILDRSEERHSNSHRITNREAWDDRNNEQDQLVHRERTNSWDPPERTLGQDSVVGDHVLRHGRSRSLREQGQVFVEPFSKYHHEGRRYSNSKSEGRHELDVLEGHPRSDWSRGKSHHTQLSTNKESSPRNRSQGLRSGDVVVLPNHVDVLEWQMSDLELQSREQLLRDEELARRLQEEEEKQLTTGRPPAPIEDFRAAQVAQDEEIAKYIQRQELKSRLRSESVNRRESIDDSRSSISSTERRQSTDQMSEGNVSHQIRLDSDGFASPRENTLPQRSPLFLCRERRDSEKQLAPKNIAEELDPTFKSKRKESQEDVFSACSQECPTPSPPHVVPVDGFYDFLDDGADPAFVQPTRRQSEKLGRQKSSNKKENCKQQ